jgi:hypothetical protein
MWRRRVWYNSTDFSKEHTSFVFRVEEPAEQVSKQGLYIFERCSEIRDSMKSRKFLDAMSDYYIFKWYSDPYN